MEPLIKVKAVIEIELICDAEDIDNGYALSVAQRFADMATAYKSIGAYSSQVISITKNGEVE